MKYLYMGSYIHLCPKMKYKGEFDPSFLLEPEQYTWHPFNECVPLLDKYLYVPFANPSLATRPIEERDAPEPKAVVVHKPTLSNQALSSLKVIQSTGSDGTLRVVPCTVSHYWESNDHRNLMIMTAEELGEQLAGEVIFKMESS
ncbi:Arginyl-tRNA--protein transferase 1 [Tulasnella sp. 419]|nr:Arginyl-tRNA--protein transferase 1 [Tulasnella sp. 418]KAG8955761.1 Arginyl-tRNA--protein transferase 1 [Tulasnella sp. 419]